MFRRDHLHGALNRYGHFLHLCGWLALFSIVTVTGTALIMAQVPTSDAIYIASASTEATADKSAQVAPAPAAPAKPAAAKPVLKHVAPPAEVRGLYMTSYSAASAQKRRELFEYAKRNDLNAIVIDIKDFGGALAFDTQEPLIQEAVNPKPTIPNLDAVLAEAKSYGLYTIARQFVFQDPEYARRHPDQAVLAADGQVWKDFKGISWVDPAAKGAWDFNLWVAIEAYRRGFDEIQFDYIRFPSDGNMKTVEYAVWDGVKPKHEVVGDFYRFMHQELEVRRHIPISLDMFGYVTWYRDFDLGIGQLLADGLPNSTAVSAMVYPSHYSAGSLNYANPAEHPYEIVQYSLAKANSLADDYAAACANGAEKFLISSATGTKSAVAMTCGATLARQRPWLQAFDLGATYTKELINAQIKATRDEGGGGWLLWNARNVYRDLK